jgi:hypothetical protein
MTEFKKRNRSWKDIDNAKGHHKRVERPGSSAAEKPRSRSYRSELDRFFDSGVASSRIQHMMKDLPERNQKTESSERIKLIRRVRSAETFDSFIEAVNGLRESGGLPSDVELLTRALEHPDQEAVREALVLLAEMSGRLSILEMKGISSRLETVEVVHDDPDTLNLVHSLRSAM